MSGTPAPKQSTPWNRAPVLNAVVRVGAAAATVLVIVAVFGIVYDACIHAPQVPLFIGIVSGIFAAGVGPGLLLFERLLGKATYPRARLFAFAAAGVIAIVTGGSESSGWFLATPLPLIATGFTAVAVRPTKS